MEPFDVPIVLFLFKREEKTVKVIDRVAQVKPSKIYLIADGPRNKEEKKRTDECRHRAEEAISWNCTVIRNYANENKGVYDRIGHGAKWVFQQEESAIFLEDDNLPDPSFFHFCREMLQRYQGDTRVLWICGTNYLEQYSPQDGSSYVFTRHTLPCGWASWSSKFTTYYDGEMSLWNDSYVRQRTLKEIDYVPLRRQLERSWSSVKYQFRHNGRPTSWDYQMSFAQRAQNLFAIVPKNNLVENIGADVDSEHGGISLRNKMTRRFCNIKTHPLEFPLVHPKCFMTDIIFEKKTSRIITLPLDYRIKGELVAIAKKLMGINVEEPIRSALKNRKKRSSSE